MYIFGKQRWGRPKNGWKNVMTSDTRKVEISEEINLSGGIRLGQLKPNNWREYEGEKK